MAERRLKRPRIRPNWRSSSSISRDGRGRGYKYTSSCFWRPRDAPPHTPLVYFCRMRHWRMRRFFSRQLTRRHGAAGFAPGRPRRYP